MTANAAHAAHAAHATASKDAADTWRQWRERRPETVSAPYRPLALTGTSPSAGNDLGDPRLEDFPDGRLPDTPGAWVADEDAVVPTATGSDGPTVDGKPFSGEVRLGADTGPTDAARVALDDRRLVVLVREGVWGVRDFAPDSAGPAPVPGVDATPYGARRAVPARFTPYAEDRTRPGAERRRA